MSEQNRACGQGSCGGNVMPAVSFISFILSLNTTALFHLGEISHPETGQKMFDLELARNAIDTLAMLEEKTKGNVDSQEQELISRVVYELKMRFIKVKNER